MKLYTRRWKEHGGEYQPSTVKRQDGHCVLAGLLKGRGGHIGWVPDDCRPQGGRLIFDTYGGRDARTDVRTVVVCRVISHLFSPCMSRAL